MWRRICATTGGSIDRAKAETSCTELFKWAAHFEEEDDRATKLERGVARLCHLVDCVLAGFSGGQARSEDEFLVKWVRPEPEAVKKVEGSPTSHSKRIYMATLGLRPDGTKIDQPARQKPKPKKRR